MKLFSTAEAAKKIGCSPRTVHRIAAKLGIPKVGNACVFTATQVKQIAAQANDGPGNPTIAEQSAKGVAARKKQRQT